MPCAADRSLVALPFFLPIRRINGPGAAVSAGSHSGVRKRGLHGRRQQANYRQLGVERYDDAQMPGESWVDKNDHSLVPGYRNYLVFCDDSGLHGSTHYGFGSLWMPSERRGDIHTRVRERQSIGRCSPRITWMKPREMRLRVPSGDPVKIARRSASNRRLTSAS